MKAKESTWESHPLSQNDHLQSFFSEAKTLARSHTTKLRDRFGISIIKHHPLLKGFCRARYGKLLLTTPDHRTFALGKNEDHGPDVRWKINDWNCLDSILARGEMGLAETYIAGKWESDDLAALLTYGLNNADTLERYFYGNAWMALWASMKTMFKKNSLRISRKNVLAHYDLGNKFYALWLDKSMTYSCALFDGKDRTLEQAQQAKYQRILDKLALPAGSHVLDIGCGWGGFAEAAARQGLRVTGITLSDAQRDFAVERMRKNGLDKLVDIQLRDYRKLTDMYDGIVSIGMFEHVGDKFWPQYFDVIKRHLKPGGTAIIQSITLDDKVFRRTRGKVGFVEQVIFPGGVLPSREVFAETAKKSGLACNEIFAFGKNYAETLRHWSQRFENQLPAVRAMGYDEFFIRFWRFYLASCIASFESNRSSVMQAQLVHAKI